MKHLQNFKTNLIHKIIFTSMACDQDARRAKSGVVAREGAMASGKAGKEPDIWIEDTPSTSGRSG